MQILDVVRSKIELKKRGGDYIGLCPFHSEKTPSFSVNPAKNFYYCFGCHSGGDAIGFVAQANGMSYREAALLLASQYHINLPTSAQDKQELDEIDSLHNVLELALEFYHRQLNAEILKYLAKRGVNDYLIKKFQLGYAPSGGALQRFLESKKVPLLMMDKAGLLAKKDGLTYEVFRDRVIFPIRNHYNKLIAFGGRAIGEVQPKYLNSPETTLFKKGECFYGENFAYTNCYKNNRAIVVEGYFDQLKMQTAGFSETVATLGTAVTERHLERLWSMSDEILMCLDGDEAGRRASKKVIELALPKIKANKFISFVILPKGNDPDDIITSKGSDYMEKCINNRITLSQMIWLAETKDKIFLSAEEFATLEAKLASYLQPINDILIIKSYKRFFSDQIWQIRKRKVAKFSNQVAPSFEAVNNNLLELAIIAMLIKFPDLFDDVNIATKLQNVEFSQQYTPYINKEQVGLLEKDILPILEKNNPGLLHAINKKDPKVTFSHMLKEYRLMLIKNKYKELAANDPKKFLENYNACKNEVDQALREK